MVVVVVVVVVCVCCECVQIKVPSLIGRGPFASPTGDGSVPE